MVPSKGFVWNCVVFQCRFRTAIIPEFHSCTGYTIDCSHPWTGNSHLTTHFSWDAPKTCDSNGFNMITLWVLVGDWGIRSKALLEASPWLYPHVGPGAEAKTSSKSFGLNWLPRRAWLLWFCANLGYTPKALGVVFLMGKLGEHIGHQNLRLILVVYRTFFCEPQPYSMFIHFPCFRWRIGWLRFQLL